MHDQAEKLRQIVQTTREIPRSRIIKNSSGSNARVITVTSGKGGVGKTNFTVNLALALAELDQRVLLIDADLGMANVDVVLGCSAKYSILNLLEDHYTLRDVVAEGPCGIKFMTGGSGIYHLANLSTMQLQRITSQITQFDNWADIILIDTGAGINQNVLNFVMAADEVIIITTPEPTAITDAYAMMKAYVSNKGSSPLNLVVNRVLTRDEGQSVVDKLNKVATRFLGQTINELGFVYEDQNVVKSVKNQTPFLLAYPDSISARCVKKIANRLLYGENNISHPRGIKGFFDKILRLW
ncbi:MAG: ylxH [Anaerosporomusa subterranea]|jgi:flagellar biosynthesis protein FlhG|nr:ylxH [Anaerosporomusa subterranea]